MGSLSARRRGARRSYGLLAADQSSIAQSSCYGVQVDSYFTRCSECSEFRIPVNKNFCTRLFLCVGFSLPPCGVYLLCAWRGFILLL